jgi:hypothetical protein
VVVLGDDDLATGQRRAVGRDGDRGVRGAVLPDQWIDAAQAGGRRCTVQV